MNCFRFTVIIAVYNTERYLRDAVESLIRQDIGFHNIQLILIDDGSTDKSGQICNEYGARFPENVLVLHQENKGVSAARNAALSFVQGKYVNFMDSDDRISRDTFSHVWDFFEKHNEEIDIVSVPIFFFEGKQGPHPLNYKFDLGNRVIDLKREWDAVQLSISSAFVKKDCMVGVSFHSELNYGEDTELLLRLLRGKQKLGVVSTGKYLYRQRQHGERSAIQRSDSEPDRYLLKLKYLTEKTLEEYHTQLGKVPMFIQFTLMYDLQWVIRMGEIPENVLTKEEEKNYLQRVFKVISEFDDEVILRQRHLSPEYLYFLIRKKHKEEPEIIQIGNDLQLCYQNHCVGRLTDIKIDIDFVRIQQDCCVIEGFYRFYPIECLDMRLFVRRNNIIINAEKKQEFRKQTVFGETLFQLHGFCVQVPLQKGVMNKIQFGIEANGMSVYPACHYGWYAPVCEETQNGYYVKRGWCLQGKQFEMIVAPISKTEIGIKEVRYLYELVTNRHHHHRKAALIRMIYWLAKPWKRKPIWMISDRRIQAGDNGEAFFRFLREKHPEIDARFILRKTASAYQDLKRIGIVIENETLREKITALLSDYIISSQGELAYINPLYRDRSALRDIMADKPFVFLQHGIIHDDLSQWLMKPNKNLYGLVTSAIPEYRSILQGKYGYTEEEVWLTGLPRYDRLQACEPKKQITIMPTWRRYLMLEENKTDMIHPLAPGFKESSFYQFYHSLLCSEVLNEAAKQYGYSIVLFPHPHMQPYLEFEDCKNIILLGGETEYHEVFENSALIVTDYSSAVFDAVYLGRPVLYAQFDKELFFSGKHMRQPGYFDYERDGFGEVEYTLESTINRIIEYMENGCKRKKKYKERADSFFAFHDQHNCQRVFEKIMEERSW